MELARAIGETVEGRVISVLSVGAFLDLGGADGLLHRDDAGLDRDADLSSLLWVGRVLEVRILSVDVERGRVSLGLRDDADDPWRHAAARYPNGRVLRAKVLNPVAIASGVCLFVELEPRVDALILPTDFPAGKLATDFAPGERVFVEILEVDGARRRVRARMGST